MRINRRHPSCVPFLPDLGLLSGIWASVFTSVSAFCNAGFDLMGRFGAYSSLMPYAGDILVNVTVMLLITAGGIGFLVWDDVATHKFRFKRYCLHTKIVLTVSLSLIIGGAVLFFLLENRANANLSWTEKILTSFLIPSLHVPPVSIRQIPRLFQTAANF